MYQPGDTIAYEFPTHQVSTGAAKNADSTPSCVLLRNGASTAETVTVTNVATGLYKAVVTVPSDWVASDEVQLRLTATVDGITAHDHSDVWPLSGGWSEVSPPAGGSAVMAVGYGELVELLGRRVFGKRTGFSEAETDDLNDIIMDGLQSVYQAHRWSFFRQRQTITTTAAYATGTVEVVSGVVTLTDGTFPAWAEDGVLTVDGNSYDVDSRDGDAQVTLTDTSVDVDAGTAYSLGRAVYDLPSSFDSFATEYLTYEPEGSEGYPPVRFVHEAEIRRMRQHNEYYDRPQIVAQIVEAFDATAGSQRQVVFYPTPDGEYVLTGVMNMRATMIDADNPYPLGAEVLSRVIIEACYAAAERHMDETEGVHSKRYLAVLEFAIQEDKDKASPRTLGSDRGGDETSDLPPFTRVGDLTLNGVTL